MTELLLRPLIEGFGADFGDSVVSVALDGGASRFRLDKIGSVHAIRVSWNLKPHNYDYLMAFYRTEIDFGSLPFTIKMKSVDASDLQEYTARFMGPPKVTAFHGGIHSVSATLEVVPLAHNESADQALITGGPE